MEKIMYLKKRMAKKGLLILILLVANLSLFSQQSNPIRLKYFTLETPGIIPSTIVVDTVTKTTTIYTISGYVKLKFNDLFKESNQQLIYNSYPDGSEQKVNESSWSMANGKDKTENYIGINRSLHIDIVDLESNNFLSRYIIKRKKKLPVLNINSVDRNGKLIRLGEVSDELTELEIEPDLKLQLTAAKDYGLTGVEIIYKLVNLKTKEAVYYGTIAEGRRLKLDADTEYQLSFSYDLQEESVATVHLKIKPYWYKSTTTYAITFIVLAIIGTSLLILRLKQRVNFSKKEQQKMEQAALRLQSLLNPHFTFNALSTIQGLINTDRVDEASQYLEEFSSLLRQALAKSKDVFNSLDQELDMMRLYLKLEALRFNFSWNIEVSIELNTTELEIPTLLLQPLIENAIKHGLPQLGEKGELLISCKSGKQNDTFVIIVKDNGQWINNDLRKGYGLSLTKERIQTINKMRLGQHITLDFKKDKGTEVILTFNHWIN